MATLLTSDLLCGLAMRNLFFVWGNGPHEIGPGRFVWSSQISDWHNKLSDSSRILLPGHFWLGRSDSRDDLCLLCSTLQRFPSHYMKTRSARAWRISLSHPVSLNPRLKRSSPEVSQLKVMYYSLHIFATQFFKDAGFHTFVPIVNYEATRWLGLRLDQVPRGGLRFFEMGHT